MDWRLLLELCKEALIPLCEALALEPLSQVGILAPMVVPDLEPLPQVEVPAQLVPADKV